MKRTPLKRKTALKDRTALKGQKMPLRASKRAKSKKAIDPSKKVKQKGYKPPSWFMSIPANGTHGNTANQKRYWRVITNFCRQRDFNKYGKCVSCGIRFTDWKESQGGHYIPYGNSNAWFKFSVLNVHGQCASCNYNLKKSAADVGYAFGKELIRRYGEKYLKELDKENEKYRGQKIEDMEIVARVENLLAENPWFVLP